MVTPIKGKARIYCAGGAGINIGKKLEQFRDADDPGLAIIESAYIDTSMSNLDTTVSQDFCYLFKDVDGSGKIRRENHAAIRDETRKILQVFEPRDINVVISSASGGSGSVIAPSLVAELLEKDQQVIVIIIGSTKSAIEIQNTLNTLKSYESISGLKEKPVVAAYFENSAEAPRDKIDNAVIQILSTISLVFSRQNSELDTKDLYNFLNYHRSTSYKPRLVGLMAHLKTIASEVSSDVISVVQINDEGKDEELSFRPEYVATGYLKSSVEEEIRKTAPLYLTTHNDVFSAVAQELQAVLTKIEEGKNARVTTKLILNSNDKPTEDGLIL